MDFETIVLKKDQQIATITLNRPDRKNAINLQMFKDLATAIEDVGKEEETRVLVITGAGKGFCSGADIDAVSVESLVPEQVTVEDMRRASAFEFGHKIIMGLHRMEKPTIAMINGACVGAGFDMALACDMRTGSLEYTKFLCGFVKLGLYPGFGAAWLYPRMMGLAKAFEMLFTGDAINGEEAHRLGILNHVVPADKLEETTYELASKIVKGPPLAIRLMKAQVLKGLQTDIQTALDTAAMCEAITMTSLDFNEALGARFGTGEPKFQGR
jgi:enoyl-CoA hydratase/carnithine racemase